MAAQHEEALSTAKKYFDFWARNDATSLREILREDVTIVLRNSNDGTPNPSSVFEGMEGALGYISFASATFEDIALVDQEWIVSHDARSVHLHAVGDMRTREGGREYRNVYVFRVDLDGDKIIRVLEYSNPVIWANLGIG